MKLVEEIYYQVDIDRLKRHMSLIQSNPLYWRFSGLSIQHRPGIFSPWDQIDGLESLRLYENCMEKDFNVVQKSFKNTEFEKIINDFNLVRSRIMWLKGTKCYSIHQDSSWRLHIPIKTNPDCLFYFPDHKEHFHLKEGKTYKVNTTERHTFINTDVNDRIHFIGCIYK
jgi:hypothetical protein